ncbi:MAG TPA: sigma 54-interacting transcriptional regulator [Terriglobia bacterium]|nr:sigma 54-interacting transcriptional regulator [Terriglobia bacterium]
MGSVTSIPSSTGTSDHAVQAGPAIGREGDQKTTDCLVASSPPMARILTRLERLAPVDVPVLLLGESGVGKEVAARQIHKLSPRAYRPFLKVNCAALPADLLESELFGYEPGAFTGATKAKPGQFELCNKGTILLDEIGELPPALQAKLLHVLQDRQFSRLGGRSLVTVDVRILAATNVDIERALEEKRLREDLYYRLSAFTVYLPPLRERREDITPLLYYFMERFAARLGRPPLAFSPRLIQACVRYPWPGNVRELENFVKCYLVLQDEEAALSELLGKNGHGNGNGHGGGLLRIQDHPFSRTSDLKAMVKELKAEAEKQAIRLALERSNGCRSEAARLLNISGKALLYKLRQYEIVFG